MSVLPGVECGALIKGVLTNNSPSVSEKATVCCLEESPRSPHSVCIPELAFNMASIC